MFARCRPWLALLSLLPLLVGCASSPTARPSAGATPAAKAPTDVDFEARALLLLLADRRMYEAQTLEAMLGGSPTVRRALAVAIGRIGDPAGRSLLQGLLVDSDVETRRVAAFALGELGASEAQRSLVVAAVDDDPEVGTLAVEALGKLAAPLAEVRRALGALEPAAARRRLAPSLFRFKEEGALAAATDLLAISDPEVRRGAAYALGRNPRPEALKQLRDLLAESDSFVRAAAARGLGEVGGLDDLGRLLPLLDDAALSPCVQALRAGAKILGRAEALPPLAWGERLSLLTVDPRPMARAAALEAAGRFLPHPGLEAALRRAWSSGEPRERELALLALVAGRVDDAPALVAEAAASPDRWLRVRAAEAAGTLGDRELLARLATDGEAPVRGAALGALVPLGESAVLLAALADRDPTVRATALDGLADSPELASARIAELVDRARADGAQNDVRLTGIRVLVARAKTPPAGDRTLVVEALGQLATDRDYLVRRAAADGLVALGAPKPSLGAIDTGRDLAVYREILRQTDRPRRVAVDTDRVVPAAGPRRLLRRPAVPPRRAGFRGAGRRPPGRRLGRAGILAARRDQPSALRSRRRRHGALRPRYRWQPVLRHALAATASRRRLHRVRPGRRRRGGARPAAPARPDRPGARDRSRQGRRGPVGSAPDLPASDAARPGR